MSRFVIVTRPDLARGFHLAGVEAYGVEDVESAEELIASWLKGGETGLLAIDDGLLARMNLAIIDQLEKAEHLSYLPIPVGDILGPEYSRQHRIAERIRRAIGIHIAFKEKETGGDA